MSQLNPDLEANLVSNRSSNPNDDALLLDTQPEANDDDRRDQFSQVEYSLTFNLLAVFVPGPKILATITVLLAGKSPCFGAKQMWLLCMLVHDLIHFVIVALRIQAVLDLARFYRNGSQVHPSNDQGIQMSGVNQQPDQESYNNIAESGNNGPSMAKIIKKRALVTKLNALCTYLWMLLFLFWLELDAVSEQSECDTPAVDNLVLAYVIIGWIWLLNPVIICMLGCLCLPVLLIVLCIFGKPAQTPASTVEIQNLPAKPYTPDLPGNKECAICIVDYQADDSIVQLECSEMHHFHEACLKDWLKINGLCPICRARLGEKRQATSEATRENTQLNNSQQEMLRL